MLHSILNKCSTTYDHYYGRHRCDPRGGCICDATASRVPRIRAPADPCVANTRTKRQRKDRLSIERDGKKCTGVLSKDNLSGQGSIEYPSGDRYLNTVPVAIDPCQRRANIHLQQIRWAYSPRASRRQGKDDSGAWRWYLERGFQLGRYAWAWNLH